MGQWLCLPSRRESVQGDLQKGVMMRHGLAGPGAQLIHIKTLRFPHRAKCRVEGTCDILREHSAFLFFGFFLFISRLHWRFAPSENGGKAWKALEPFEAWPMLALVRRVL
jgi:hypothetical protein